jgi:beta-galactosidase
MINQNGHDAKPRMASYAIDIAQENMREGSIVRVVRILWLLLATLAATGVLPASAATMLTIDARQQPPVPETGYFHFGTAVSPNGHAVGINSQYLTLDGKPWLPVMGEFHFTRVPNRYWKEELLKMKSAGVSIVSTYIFWNHHEEKEGQFVWTQDRDLRRFVTICGQIGLKVFIRPGPWVHSEARFGGIPDWVVHAVPTRSNDPTYLRYVARYWGQIAAQLKGLLWKDGGPIIGIQLENEFNLTGPGQGREHIAALKQIALAAGFDVPLYTVTGWDNTVFPQHEVAPVFGGYADEPWGLSTEKLPPSEVYAFRFDSRVRGNLGAETTNVAQGDADAAIPHTPFLGAEFGGGVPTMYRRRPIMMPDDTAAMLPVQLGSGVNLYGYYMFHGGQNSPDHSSLEENTSIGAYNDLPMIDYDFQAPLGAYGQQHAVMNKIRPFHYFLQAFGSELAPMEVHRPAEISKGSGDLVTPRFSVRSLGDSGFLFVNNYVRQYAMAEQKGVQFAIQLPDEAVTLPSRPIDIPSGAYFIWPIDMDLSGVRLIYASAQPVTRIDAGGTPVFVFHAQDRIPVELAFDGRGVIAVTSSTAKVFHDPQTGRFMVTDLQAGTNASIDVTTTAGHSLRILVLDQAQADGLSIADLDGKPHLLLTNAQVFSDNGELDLLSTGDPHFRFAIFPALPRTPLGDLTTKAASRDGVFQVFEADAPVRHMSATLTKIRDAQPVPPLVLGAPANTAHEPMPETFGKSAAWTITVTGDVLGGDSDAFLRIRARGDIARLFSGLSMIDDHFLDGGVWEIGLKRFPSEIKTPLVLTILPLRNDSPVYLDGGVAKMVSGDQTADASEVTIVPQYRLRLQTGKAGPQ